MIAIAAVDKNFGIGFKGNLLAHIPEDMKRFKALTTGNVVVLGRKTLDGFPNGAPLKNRTNIILSTNLNFNLNNAIVVRTMEQLLEEIKKYDKDSVFLIGGETVYSQLIDYCDKAYITKISGEYEADTYFPNLDKMENWEIEKEEDILSSKDVKYQFVEYRNKNIKKQFDKFTQNT